MLLVLHFNYQFFILALWIFWLFFSLFCTSAISFSIFISAFSISTYLCQEMHCLVFGQFMVDYTIVWIRKKLNGHMKICLSLCYCLSVTGRCPTFAAVGLEIKLSNEYINTSDFPWNWHEKYQEKKSVICLLLSLSLVKAVWLIVVLSATDMISMMTMALLNYVVQQILLMMSARQNFSSFTVY